MTVAEGKSARVARVRKLARNAIDVLTSLPRRDQLKEIAPEVVETYNHIVHEARSLDIAGMYVPPLIIVGYRPRPNYLSVRLDLSAIVQELADLGAA